MSKRPIPPHPPISAEVLGRYLAGTASPDERAQVDRWRRADPFRRALLDQLVTRSFTTHATADDVERRWQRIHRGMSVEATPAQPLTERGPSVHVETHAPPPHADRDGSRAPESQRTVWTYVSTWVVPVFLLMVGIVAYYLPKRTPSSTTVHQYVTRVGEQAHVTLRDGSQITLAPQSKVTVANEFGGDTRSVTLEGEAYFHVRSGAPAPFVIRSGDVTTRVLGTEFDVRRYSTDRTVRVAVVSGKVAAGGRGTPVTLTAGMVGRVTDSTATSSVVGNAAQYGEWQSGRLIFDNEPVADVLAAVGRWYGYAFQLADSAYASQRITAEFNIASREKTLRAIAVLLNVTMQFDGATVTLRPRKDRRTDHRMDTIAPFRGDHYPFSRLSEVGK